MSFSTIFELFFILKNIYKYIIIRNELRLKSVVQAVNILTLNWNDGSGKGR